MWAWGWEGALGLACGALAGALALLLARRRKRAPAPPRRQVQLVVGGALPARVAAPPPAPAPAPRASLTLLTAPADDAPPATPHIVIVPNPQPSTSRTSESTIPKLPLPEQWLHKRPFEFKYPAIPRPLVQIVQSDLGAELNQETRAKKFSATRSPSLEKDDKSPFLASARAVDNEVFGFDPESVTKLEKREMSDKVEALSPKEGSEESGSLKRYRSVSTRLNVCTVDDEPPDVHQERAEMQNSPRVLECGSAKEKSSTPKFDFSPKLLADSMSSPRFFTPPEMASPMFFTEPSPKSVYYDTVKSPKFFADTPRDAEVPQSPRALGDHLNRSNGVEKPSSPKVLSARPSPKIFTSNKENYFNFEYVIVGEEGASRISPRPRKYGGRNSIEKERFTPPADKETKKYRRHNSCDTNYKNIELNISKGGDNKQAEAVIPVVEKDVVDCCAKIDMMNLDAEKEPERTELLPTQPSTAHARRQRLKSISLDSDNAKIIEQNLGLPIAKQMKDQMNEAYKNQEVSTSCESMERHLRTPTAERPMFKFEEHSKEKPLEEEEPKSPDLKLRKSLRQSSDTQSFLDMPRFSPKEFEIIVTSEEGASVPEAQTKKKQKNLRNLTIDLTKRDSDLEKELLEFEQLYTNAEEKKVKTPTLKVKATSLDSSETVNLSLPQKKSLDVPQNSISVPNTPKRQLKRILAQKSSFAGGKLGYNSIQGITDRRMYMKAQDSGIFLRENHANLMLYQPSTSRLARTMGSFDENIADFAENAPEINISGVDNRAGYQMDTNQMLGSNLLNYKQNLSVSSTNLKTLPEGVPSDDFELSAEDEKLSKKLNRRNSNQSLLVSTHSLQSSNCSLSSAGASCHNLASVRNSISNFSLNSDGRKKLSLERRDSNASLMNTEHLVPTTRVIGSSNTNVSGETTKNCLLQRRGSNNSLSLNIYPTNNLSRHSSNSSLNKEAKSQKKGLLERRSSNTSLTLNINNSNPQLSVVNRGLSISNYNLNGSTCNLSRYNSNHSIDNPPAEPRKGILERRSSNTSLTLNIQPQEPRDLEIDETVVQSLKEPPRDKHRKSLSTENLIPKSYQCRPRLRSSEKGIGFGSHDNLWSSSYVDQESYPRNLTCVGGDQENEIIYAFGREEDPIQQGFVRNITTKPLSPQSTSEDFRMYLANMQHLQNASSVLTRQQLRDLNDVFVNGYSTVKCHGNSDGQHCCSGWVKHSDISAENPQMVIPEPVSKPCSEYQKGLLRSMHQEFWDMPTNFQEKPIVSGSHPKNRYKAILPNEHSRFILRADAGSASEGYINASYIKGHEYTKDCYIATQGPLPNTIYDFWLMVRQNYLDFHHQASEAGPSRRPSIRAEGPGVQKIVMLTNFVENNRQKCEKYFPVELNEEVTFYEHENLEIRSGDANNYFTIKNTGMVRKPGYTIRKLSVKYSANSDSDSELTAYHYWFHNWADHKCPKDVNALLNLSLDVLLDNFYDFSEVKVSADDLCKCSGSPKVDSKFVFPPLEAQGSPCEADETVNVCIPLNFSFESKAPQPIIHCSAGIGRTGCLIGILNGIKQLTIEQKVDILGIVCNMRLNRGGMVQNSEQYELIHKVLCLFEQICLPNL